MSITAKVLTGMGGMGELGAVRWTGALGGRLLLVGRTLDEDLIAFWGSGLFFVVRFVGGLMDVNQLFAEAAWAEKRRRSGAGKTAKASGAGKRTVSRNTTARNTTARNTAAGNTGAENTAAGNTSAGNTGAKTKKQRNR